MGDENPDWLPVGWMVTVKIRSYGKKDKYYTNPSNGLKFNSKAEVLRYLKSSAKAQKPEERNKIDIRRTGAEKLPPGWIKETRTKMKGRRTRTDPYYIDPVSGRRFRSLPQVFRYLQDSGQTESKSDEQDHVRMNLENHSQSSSAEAIEQSSIDMKADKTISRCKKIISELELNGVSKGSAMDNVNVAENNQVEHKEDDKSFTIELSDKLQPVSRAERYTCRTRKCKELTENTVRERFGGGCRLKSGSKVVTPKKVNTWKETYVEQKVREGDSLAGDCPNKLRKVNGREDSEAEINQNNTATDSTLENDDHSSLSGSKDVTEDINVPTTTNSENREECYSVGDKRQENQTLPNKRKKTICKSTKELPRRTSNRLARVDVDPSLEIKPSKKPRATASLSDKVEIKIAEKNVHGKLSSEVEINITCQNDNLDESKEQPAKSETEILTSKMQQELYVRSLFEDLSCIEDLNGVDIDSKEDERHEKQLEDSSLEYLFMDPCYEFAIKTLTGDIPIPVEDAKKFGDDPVCSVVSTNQTPTSSSAMPPGKIWADPCFEFAVKMLTGDLPPKHGSHLESGFNSLPLPKPRFGDSNYLFGGFGTEESPNVKQQGVRDDSPLPHAVNGCSDQFQPSTAAVKGKGRKL